MCAPLLPETPPGRSRTPTQVRRFEPKPGLPIPISVLDPDSFDALDDPSLSASYAQVPNSAIGMANGRLTAFPNGSTL